MSRKPTVRKVGGLIKDLTGKTFGRLQVLAFSHTAKGFSYWLCECVCKTKRNIRALNLVQGITKSCGCYNKEQQKKSCCKPGSAFREVLYMYVYAARKRGIEFVLSSDEFLLLTQKPCYFCDRAPFRARITRSKQVFVYNGVDRINNDEGYTTTNSVSCCRQCNVAKMDFSAPDFISWCTLVADKFRRAS